jgi:hypothetical protein
VRMGGAFVWRVTRPEEHPQCAVSNFHSDVGTPSCAERSAFTAAPSESSLPGPIPDRVVPQRS